jgi:hypothetical protein
MRHHSEVRLFKQAIFTLFIAVLPQASAGKLIFSAEIPAPPESMPLLQLEAVPLGIDALTKLLSSTRSDVKFERLSETPLLRKLEIKAPEELLGITEGEHVRAWTNLKSGEVMVYPTLNTENPMVELDAQKLAAQADDLFQSGLLPEDDSQFEIEDPKLLNGATLTRDANGTTQTTKAAAYLAYFTARRFVGDFRVDGPGSRALVSLARDGSVQGLTRIWKGAKIVAKLRPWRGISSVRVNISRQLRSALKEADVEVNSITLAYYDANQRFLQPVYRFTARIHHLSGQDKTVTADDFVIGYIPFNKAFEPLPFLGKSDGPLPEPAKTTTAALGPPAPNDPIVGRYVVRNDDAGWVNNANAFWDGLAASWTAPLFSNAQYFWAEPVLFTSQKDSFVNAMNVALLEVHGDWWFYTTLQNWGDSVNINGDIPSPGYGPDANGHLTCLILHSCEVIPGPDDTANWPDPWWKIFGGIHNVVGYRTVMYISDGAGGPYGSSLGALAPVVSSWLNDVISLNAYSGGPTYPAHGVHPMGRPSTISACGHDNDTVLDTSNIGRANCLTVWWFPD